MKEKVEMHEQKRKLARKKEIKSKLARTKN